MLCEHFFRNTSKERTEHSWDKLVVEPTVFEKLLWFFTPTKVPLRENLPRIHWFATPTFEEETLRTFLNNFFWMALTFQSLPHDRHYYPEERERDAQARQMFLEGRPRLLELMDAAGCSGTLLEKDWLDYEPLPLDDASMAKLEELAMIEDWRFGEIREVCVARRSHTRRFAGGQHAGHPSHQAARSSPAGTDRRSQAATTASRADPGRAQSQNSGNDLNFNKFHHAPCVGHSGRGAVLYIKGPVDKPCRSATLDPRDRYDCSFTTE